MSDPKTVYVDVREPQEFAAGHVEGAINVPPASLMSGAPQLAEIPKDTPLVMYCITGSRSNVAIRILSDLGYTNLTNGMNQARVEASLS
ncbi:MAG: rhodanese-like domain-containing protein [Patescibacteria group bacterium]